MSELPPTLSTGWRAEWISAHRAPAAANIAHFLRSKSQYHSGELLCPFRRSHFARWREDAFQNGSGDTVNCTELSVQISILWIDSSVWSVPVIRRPPVRNGVKWRP